MIYSINDAIQTYMRSIFCAFRMRTHTGPAVRNSRNPERFVVCSV